MGGAMGALVSRADKVGMWKGGSVGFLVCGSWGAWMAGDGGEWLGRKLAVVWRAVGLGGWWLVWWVGMLRESRWRGYGWIVGGGDVNGCCGRDGGCGGVMLGVEEGGSTTR